MQRMEWEWTGDFVRAQAILEQVRRGEIPIGTRCTNSFRGTLLMLAVRLSSLDQIMYLHSAGEDINATDIFGYNALMYCLSLGTEFTFNVVPYLLANTDDLSARNADGATASSISVRYGDYPTLVSLLNYGANVNEVETDELTLLMLAAEQADPAMIEMLLKRGADVNRRSSTRGTALTIATEIRVDAVIAMFLGGGAGLYDLDVLER